MSTDTYAAASEKRRYRERVRKREGRSPPRSWLDAAWKAQAACRDLTPEEADELFFAGSSSGDRDPELNLGGFTFCNVCDVADACLEYALTLRVEFGVFGGRTAAQRRAILRERTS